MVISIINPIKHYSCIDQFMIFVYCIFITYENFLLLKLIIILFQ